MLNSNNAQGNQSSGLECR